VFYICPVKELQMKLRESKEKFINAWGTLGNSWGINRTMAQVHALLLISPDPLSAEEIMEELNISRGNANMNTRTLIDWGLVQKELRSGERKEYFVAEKDIWKVFKQIARERRKRELEPIFKVLDEVKNVEGDKKDRNIKAFLESIEEIERFTHKADRTLETMIKADENWLIGTFMKLMK
jgi:DNA-binding transcriptional regulator GbsR (MarR family)